MLRRSIGLTLIVYLSLPAASRGESSGDAAIAALEEAVKLAPDSGELRAKLAQRICEETRNVSVFRMPAMARRCREQLELAVDLAPGDAAARHQLMLFYLMAPKFFGGGRDKAMDELAVIEKLDAFYAHLARANVALHDKQDAVPELKLALDAARSDRERARALRAIALYGREVEGGLDAAERAREIDPETPATWYALGRAYARAGRNVDAKAAYATFLAREADSRRADEVRKRIAELH